MNFYIAQLFLIFIIFIHSFSCPSRSTTQKSENLKHRWHLGIPIIDSHVHLDPTMVALSTTLEVFDRVGIERFAVKSGGYVGTPRYQATLAMQKVLRNRMKIFANIDWSEYNKPDFVQNQIKNLEQMKKDGIVGIKIFKNLGLHVRDENNKLVMPDNPRIAPIFETCGRLGLILAWHVADPVAFFKPPTPDNERYEELKIAQEWSFYGKDYPSFDELIATQEKVIAAHPKTVFLLMHFANYAENLEYVDKLLDKYPNVYIDTSARVPEIGRHPAEKVRKLFIKHQNRILFGSDFIVDGDGSMQLGSVWHIPDSMPSVEDAVLFFERHWQYFETKEKQIPHPTPIQGKWKIDAISLPKDVLKKFYITNAENLIFSGK